MNFGLTPAAYSDLPGWAEDDPTDLFSPMRRCLDHISKVKPYRTGALGLRSEHLASAFEESLAVQPKTAAEARRFFESRFRPFRIDPHKGAGFVTAYYEPIVDVSDQPDELFRFPFHRRPDDLVDLDESNRPFELDSSYAFGRRLPEGGIGSYFDRADIDRGALAGRGLEIAWARSRVDVFFVHVQGAARLRYPDGAIRRITYAAKAGHPFTGIGRRLIDLGEIAEADVSMQSIRAWLAAHEERQDEILWTNRSYIFFRDAEVSDPTLGPVAAAKIPLQPMRSIAVDRLLHTFSSLFYLSSDSLTHLSGGRPFRRLMMALDTGTAIVGPARADIFTGSGDEAGELAGNVRNDADFFILLPVEAARELGHGD
ncbi:membrane-bound lytic murein transglycosylase A [Rhizobium sp. SG_E_25_P2]|uniref:murein transglycosylase A n=1 Tax=Rhizobium sp. SG_E_25_P2 TaxID=2879942 RepID=UPI002474598C|nr:murein transglycosylase A [Rhizobium sp. SG_E_25_P2]MDH6269333.1 membrane-bound lytic murein transglycosylase A [Rhizobium sp. SG_E_25_P2]